MRCRVQQGVDGSRSSLGIVARRLNKAVIGKHRHDGLHVDGHTYSSVVF